MSDNALTPSILNELRALRHEVALLKRTPRWRSQAFPTVPLGVVQDFGFTSFNTTSFLDFFRADVNLTAPILQYDIQVTNTYETTAVTSIEWQISAQGYFDTGSGPFTPVVVVDSGSATAAELTAGSGFKQFQGRVDVTDPSFLGPEALFRMVRFDFECKRTGGSGDGAALRMVHPPILRIS